MTTKFSPQRMGFHHVLLCTQIMVGFLLLSCSSLHISFLLFSALLLALWGWAYCITRAALPLASLSSAHETLEGDQKRAGERL